MARLDGEPSTLTPDDAAASEGTAKATPPSS